MSVPPEVKRQVRQWIEKADHDLKNVEYTLTLAQDCPLDTVCFHAQQYVEKSLKSLLVLNQRAVPRTHDLVHVLNHVTQVAVLPLSADDIRTLNRYAVETRYPGFWDEIERD